MTDEGWYAAARRLLDRGDRPSAIFASNDLSAIGVLSAAAALGLAVPAQLSLVGFDDSDAAVGSPAARGPGPERGEP